MFHVIGHVGDCSHEHKLLLIDGGEVKGEFTVHVVEAVNHLQK